MQAQLQKAIRLAKKTGDRLIVFDSAHTGDIYVVMSLDEYEKLVIGRSEVRGLTEEELLDKINRDIAIWKSEQDFWEDRGKKDNDYFVGEVSDVRRERPRGYNHPFRKQRDDERNNREGESREVYIDDDDMRADADSKRPERMETKKKNPWAIPSARKEAAEEIIEEDRQYLEEVN